MNRFACCAIIACSALAGLNGCGSSGTHTYPATQDATAIDERQAEPDYWLSLPARATVNGNDFDRLWETADEVSRELLFHIDRRDRRGGVMTTEPTVSAQWFEPWRRELQSGSDVAGSSVATIRRTIYYTFQESDAGYMVSPKVLVERQSVAGARVSGVLTRNYFRSARGSRPTGSRELDAGVQLPGNYWYPIGRDELLEAKLAEMMRQRLAAG
ncbi:MAG: hypothetical protein H7144_05045 [Burkholderiales bacterium]|nr:hypothetical protein [Phycisphaerae bacterium]